MSNDKTESRVTGEEAIIQGFLAPARRAAFRVPSASRTTARC